MTMNDHAESFWYIDAKANVSMIPTETGGKSCPVLPGYRPNHKLAEGVFCMGLFRLIEGGGIKPGDSARVDIFFVVLDDFISRFKDGMVWDINEGVKTVGHGEILSIKEIKKVPINGSRRQSDIPVGITVTEAVEKYGVLDEFFGRKI